MDMNPKNIFKRLESKFLITQEQYTFLHGLIAQHTTPDSFGSYLVQSIYFDTPDWAVIRHSIENPPFKQKMRLRCYGMPTIDSMPFLEIKKKCHNVVYKRRLTLPLYEGLNIREEVAKDNSLTGREFLFYLERHPVYERAHVSYRRQALENDSGLRVTFDSDIRFRSNMLHYQNPRDGLTILPPRLMIMEVKTLGGMPLWLASSLSENKIYPTPFSKVGEGYKKYVLGGK